MDNMTICTMTNQQVSASPSGYLLIGYLHNRPDTPSTVPHHSSGHPGATLLPDLKSSVLSRLLVFLRQTPSRQTWFVVVTGFIIGLRQTTKHGHSKGQREVRKLLFPSHAPNVLIENLTVFIGPYRPHSCTYAHTHAHTCTRILPSPKVSGTGKCDVAATTCTVLAGRCLSPRIARPAVRIIRIGLHSS